MFIPPAPPVVKLALLLLFAETDDALLMKFVKLFVELIAVGLFPPGAVTPKNFAALCELVVVEKKEIDPGDASRVPKDDA